MSHSERTSRQEKITKSRQRDVSVSNDEEEISSYSFDVDSGNFARNPNISKNCQKTSSYEIREEINSSDDTTEEDAAATTTDIIRPRRSIKFLNLIDFILSFNLILFLSIFLFF